MKKLLLFSGFLLVSFPALSKDAVMCTMDARQCPDGSYVSRQGPNCEFAPCPGQSEEKEPSEPLYIPLTLERIIDGDTIAASGKTIRLWGIDTPERGEPLYEEAGLALQLFLEGAQLICKQVDIDRYQREVMHCLVNEADLGSLMVKAGWAKDYTKYSGGFYQTEEEFARQNLLGVWKEK